MKRDKGLILACIIMLLIGLGIYFSGTVLRGKKVMVSADGITKELISPAATVGELLSDINFVLASQDIVQPELNTSVTEGMEIKITRIVEKEIIEKETIPFTREYRNDSANWKGQNKVLQKGKEGVLVKTFVIIYANNKETDRRLIKEEITRNPVKEIVAQGTKQIAQRSGSNLDFKKTLLMSATAYTHTGNKTYTGAWPKRGTVAVDPKIIPLGSKLYIDGYGYGTAQDIGTAIKGERIDLFMETKEEAIKWGRKPVRVFVLN
ncbi:MAG: 3D domain-containing protein [Bacillota bacterium]